MVKKFGAFELDSIGWWVIGFLVLVVVIAGLIVLKGKGVGAVQYIKNIFNFGA